MSIFPSGCAEIVSPVDEFTTVYSVQVNGHCIDVLETRLDSRDYSARVDGVDVFTALRFGEAKREIEKVLRRLE